MMKDEVMFKYFISYEDFDYGPDAATGEPVSWPVEIREEISRDQALSLIKAGRTDALIIRPVKGKIAYHSNGIGWIWDETRRRLAKDLPF